MTGLVILAAGSSSRLGTPKQNLFFKGKTLLRLAVDAAVNSVCKPVVLVLGANSESIVLDFNGPSVKVIQNDIWAQGMASSIRAGLNAVLDLDDNLSGVVFMLCDQPFADEHLVNRLIDAQAPGQIVASAYNNMLGVPVLFDKKYFADLQALKGEEGARKLLIKYASQVTPIAFPLGSVDVDTMKDYQRL